MNQDSLNQIFGPINLIITLHFFPLTSARQIPLHQNMTTVSSHSVPLWFSFSPSALLFAPLVYRLHTRIAQHFHTCV